MSKHKCLMSVRFCGDEQIMDCSCEKFPVQYIRDGEEGAFEKAFRLWKSHAGLIPKWIKQEHENGCGFAALAMLTNQTYAQVVRDFSGVANKYGFVYDPNILSPTYYDMDRYLNEYGIAVCRVYKDTFPLCVKQSRQWPVKPFAELHLVNVRVNSDSKVTHWVVMLYDGDIFDPLTPEIKTLASYFEVISIAGVAYVFNNDEYEHPIFREANNG